MPPRLRGILLGCAVAVATFAVLVWRFAEPDAVQALRPPPEIPALTLGEFAAAPDAHLLELVAAEGTRRILLAGRGWDGGREVLPDELRHLWTIAVMEADLHQSGFAHVLRLAAGPTPMLPPLADLAAAYRALGHDALAAAVETAMAGDAGRADAAFRTAIAVSGLRAQRIAYARRNRAFLTDVPP